MPFMEFTVEGLKCASCAAKIEEKLNSLDGMSSASVDFVSNRMTLEYENLHDTARIANEAEEIIRLVEPDAKIVDGQIPSGIRDKDSGWMRLIAGRYAKLAAGFALFAAAMIVPVFWGKLTLYSLSYLILGGDILLKAAGNISKGMFFDENFLMGVSTVGAFAIGEYPEGVAVMLFYKIGETLETMAVEKSKRSIKALLEIRPEYANLKTEDGIRKVPPEGVEPGDVIVVKPGERIPLDGSVIEGRSFVDTSALTGEPVEVEVSEGSEVKGGFINRSGLLAVKVGKRFEETTLSKILDLVKEASGRKTPTENFITRFARYYTPLVVLSSFLIALIPPFVTGRADYSAWVYRALIFLVSSCPCALMVSVPLSFFAGIGGASRNGVLVKGGNFLEALSSVDSVVFDKTGTLTEGKLQVAGLFPAEGVSPDRLLEYAAYAESFSGHPVAAAVLKAYKGEIDIGRVKSYEEIAGHGVVAHIESEEVIVGNLQMMNMHGVECRKAEKAGMVLYVAVNRVYAGCLIVSDILRRDSKKTIEELKKLGVRRTVMLTGDGTGEGERIAAQLGIDQAYFGLMPHQKVEMLGLLEKEKKTKGRIVFVGDGINDAPVLSRADIGVAMGGLGSDAAIESADIILMTDEPSKLVTAIKIARRTKAIVWQNIILALSVKAAVLLLGVGGIATMWEAVFADVGVTLLAVFNAMRTLKHFRPVM